MENVRVFFLRSAARGGAAAQRGVMGNDGTTKRVMGRGGGTMNQVPLPPSSPTNPLLAELLESPGNLIPLSPAVTPPPPLINGKG